jgi:hypothetical protein
MSPKEETHERDLIATSEEMTRYRAADQGPPVNRGSSPGLSSMAIRHGLSIKRDLREPGNLSLAMRVDVMGQRGLGGWRDINMF